MLLSSGFTEVGDMCANEAGIFKAKAGLRGGYGHIRCPNPECDYILFEASKRFWQAGGIERMLCPTCGHPALFIACLQAENDAGALIVRYCCRKCEICFERTLVGVRKYCAGCHTYQNIYFPLSLALPSGIPDDQEAIAET
jgi:hypothetical protein